MKIFQNKNLFKKLIIVLLFITIFSFCMPKGVRAGGDDSVGGMLLKPFVDLMLGIGDGILDVVHKVIYHQDQSLVTVDMSSHWWDVFWTGVVAIVVAVAAAILVVVTAGAVVAAFAAIGVALSAVSVGTVLMVSVSSGAIAAAVFNSNALPDDLKLPIYNISPEEIFSNDILLFDVDFFNPKEGKVIDNTTTKTEDDYTEQMWKYIKDVLKKDYGYDESNVKRQKFEESSGMADCPDSYTMDTWDYNGKTYAYSFETDGKDWSVIRYDAGTQGKNYEWLKWQNSDDNYGKKLSWDSDASKAKWDPGNETVNMKGKEVTEGEKYELESTAKQLRNTVASWYNTLRDISIVALLSVLVYIGIRIIISSTSSDKAKYKQMLVDWVIALCLLFLMQYIMSFSNLLVGKLTEVVKSSRKSSEFYELIEDKNGKIEKALEKIGEDTSGLKTSSEGSDYILWKTNLLGLVRLDAQMATDSTITYAGYAIIFVILVLFTIYFIFTYLKRVLYMAFLTIIAPMVALTYPIDKMNDGKAQAFDMWFKEYIFNLLIQPLHLLLYTILVSSALELASTNIIYSVVAIAFMIPAEKLMRKFFGFEKAHTPGFLAGPAGAALTMNGLNKIMGHRPPKSGEHGNSNGGKDDEGALPRFDSSFDKQDAMINGGVDPLFMSEGGNESKNEKDNMVLNDDKNKFNASIENDKNGLNAGLENDKNGLNAGLENDKNSLNAGLEDDKNVPKNVSKNGDEQSENMRLPVNRRDNGRDINVDLLKKENPPFPKKHRIRGASAAVRAYSRNRLQRSLKNAHPLRTVSKMALGAAGATAFGLTAGTIGLATGDPTKAMQFASTGVLGGYKLGSSTGDSLYGALEPTIDVRDEYKRARADSKEQYEQEKVEEAIKKMRTNSDNLIRLEHEFGHKEAKQIIKDGVIDDYASAGIDDIDDIIAGYKLEKEDKDVTREQVKSAVKYSSRIGQDTSKMKGDDIAKWEKTFSEEFAENSRVRTQNINANALGHKTMETVKKFNKFKY